MRTSLLPLALLVLAACPPPGAPATGPGTNTASPRDPASGYTHRGSGMHFPDAIGSWRRTDVRDYDRTGDNIGVAYELMLPRKEASATVFVYPTGSTRVSASALERHFEMVLDQVRQAHRDARVVSSDTLVVTQGGEAIRGLRATLAFQDAFSGPQVQPLLSHAYLFARGPWYIKYRITYPANRREVVEPEVRRLLEALVLPR